MATGAARFSGRPLNDQRQLQNRLDTNRPSHGRTWLLPSCGNTIAPTRLIKEMPLEYKKTFNPGENLWPGAVKLSLSDVAPRPNTEIASCKECGAQLRTQSAIAAIRPMQQLKELLEQWLA